MRKETSHENFFYSGDLISAELRYVFEKSNQAAIRKIRWQAFRQTKPSLGKHVYVRSEHENSVRCINDRVMVFP